VQITSNIEVAMTPPHIARLAAWLDGDWEHFPADDFRRALAEYGAMLEALQHYADMRTNVGKRARAAIARAVEG
jgi:hypothetical protein